MPDGIPPDPPFSKGGVGEKEEVGGVASIAYLLQSLADVPRSDAWLAPAERDHLASLRVPKRRADWRLGRWTAKNALARRLCCDDLTRLAVLADDDGAPAAWVDGGRAPVSLSLSHAGGQGLSAIGPVAIALGCDLETIAKHPASLVEDYFTDAERAAVAAVSPAQRGVLVTLIWSAKEAALKAAREGLRLDTRSVDVKLDGLPTTDGWHPLTVVRRDTAQCFAGWWRRTDRRILTIASAPASGLPRAL